MAQFNTLPDDGKILRILDFENSYQYFNTWEFNFNDLLDTSLWVYVIVHVMVLTICCLIVHMCDSYGHPQYACATIQNTTVAMEIICGTYYCIT